MQNLQQLKANETSNYQVMSSIKIDDMKLIANFKVLFSGELSTNEKFSLDSVENWGLWEFDVVEIFICRNRDKVPYLELQLSPLGQKFALVVKTPRKEFDYPKNINFDISSDIEDGVWLSQMKIDLDDIPGTAQEVMGNIHACLGVEGRREYFGLSHFSDENGGPDFHRPQNFIKLGEIK